jgi:hypothetical protein
MWAWNVNVYVDVDIDVSDSRWQSHRIRFPSLLSPPADRPAQVLGPDAGRAAVDAEAQEGQALAYRGEDRGAVFEPELKPALDEGAHRIEPSVQLGLRAPEEDAVVHVAQVGARAQLLFDVVVEAVEEGRRRDDAGLRVPDLQAHGLAGPRASGSRSS